MKHTQVKACFTICSVCCYSLCRGNLRSWQGYHNCWSWDVTTSWLCCSHDDGHLTTACATSKLKPNISRKHLHFNLLMSLQTAQNLLPWYLPYKRVLGASALADCLSLRLPGWLTGPGLLGHLVLGLQGGTVTCVIHHVNILTLVWGIRWVFIWHTTSLWVVYCYWNIWSRYLVIKWESINSIGLGVNYRVLRIWCSNLVCQQDCIWVCHALGDGVSGKSANLEELVYLICVSWVW